VSFVKRRLAEDTVPPMHPDRWWICAVCGVRLQSAAKSTIAIWVSPIVRVGLTRISSQLPGLSQILVSDVTFVTFSGDKKCDASHLSHFWEECDALAHENIFLTCDVFNHILPEKRHILAPPVQNFLNGKKCDDSAGTQKFFSLPVSYLSRISEA